jgi:hypothetical protein
MQVPTAQDVNLSNGPPGQWARAPAYKLGPQTMRMGLPQFKSERSGNGGSGTMPKWFTGSSGDGAYGVRTKSRSMATTSEPDELRKARRLGKLLCSAARNGDAGKLRQLLDSGAPVDQTMCGPPWGGNTALMVASWNDRVECVALLIERGADADFQEQDYGFSAIALAAQYGSLGAARLLVEQGCDLNHTLRGGTDEGLTPRAVAAGGSSRVYGDPQPGRSIRGAEPGAGRIDSQHDAVAQLLTTAERALVGARQRLAFARALLDGGVRCHRCRLDACGCDSTGRDDRGLIQIQRNAVGGSDLVWGGRSGGLAERLLG